MKCDYIASCIAMLVFGVMMLGLGYLIGKEDGAK